MHEHHGHSNVRWTTSLIAPYYLWVGMCKDIAHVVQSCGEYDSIHCLQRAGEGAAAVASGRPASQIGL